MLVKKRKREMLEVSPSKEYKLKRLWLCVAVFGFVGVATFIMNKASDVLARLKAKRKASNISFAKASDWADFWNSQPGSNEGVVTFS